MSKPRPLSALTPPPAARLQNAGESQACEESFFPHVTLPDSYIGHERPDSADPDAPPSHMFDDSADRELSRRRFLMTSGKGLAAALLAFQFGNERAAAAATAAAANSVFTYGVASGDPQPTHVILWTRVNPFPEAIPGSGLGGKIEVKWEVSRDPSFRNLVRRGTVFTTAARDHTVKVDANYLDPNREYFYRFTALGQVSPAGRTRTAPSPWRDLAGLRFALVSCSNWEAGYFSAYRHIAARDDLDFVLHVGDYIYEYAAGVYADPAVTGRDHDPATEIVTLGDYRRRHAQYKTDPDLAALHAKLPWITTWDDHEVANDCWNGGAENHQPDTEGDFFLRRAAAYQAYVEWMPLREPSRYGDPTRIYRRFDFGKLVSLSMLDLRQYRDRQPTSVVDYAGAANPQRTMTGARQFRWLEDNLDGIRARWHLLGNSVTITPFLFKPAAQLPPQLAAIQNAFLGFDPPLPTPFNVDQWDGYSAERARLVAFLLKEKIGNVVFLTGDIHSSIANELPINAATYTGAPGDAAAVEFVCPSVTSDNLNEIIGAPPRTPTSLGAEALFKFANPYIKMIELDSHGYTIVDVTEDRIQADWFFIDDRTDPATGQTYFTSYASDSGSRALRPAAGPVT